MLGWENLFHCEINPFGRRVLDYWYPNSKSYEDITTTDFSEWRGRVNVLTGGFPCQPFSYAGKRGGAQDDRYLWPYMFRCIDQIRPDWVVAENVAGILTMVEQGEVSEVASAPALFDTFDRVRRYQLRETFTLQRICDDLEGHGYAVQPVLVPACGVGAPHRRDRVFIIGHRRDKEEDEALHRPKRTIRDTSDERPRGTADGQAAGEVRGEVREEGHHAELRIPTETSSRDGYAADTSDARIEGVRQERQDAVHRPEPIADTDGWRGFEVEESVRLQLANGTIPECSGSERASADTMRSRCNREVVLGQGEADGMQLDSDSAGLGGIAGCCRWRWGDDRKWIPTQSPVHSGNDGLSIRMDGITIPYDIGTKDKFVHWRTEALKAYGNAIVPQVMYEIFRAIQQVEDSRQ